MPGTEPGAWQGPKNYFQQNLQSTRQWWEAGGQSEPGEIQGLLHRGPSFQEEGERDLGGRRGVTYGLGGRGKQGGESEKVGERTLEERMKEHGKKSERERDWDGLQAAGT